MKTTAEREDRWLWPRFLGELLLFALSSAWFVYQPGFEPAIVALAATGSVLLRILSQRVGRLAFVVVAAVIACGLGAVAVLRINGFLDDDSQITRKPTEDYPQATVEQADLSSLADQAELKRDYFLVEDGTEILRAVLRDRTIDEIREAANAGDAESQYLLGVAYSEGEGLVSDQAAAARWFQRSAENGFSRGKYALGSRLLKGIGIPSHQVDALKWLQESADAGIVPAEAQLGYIFLWGEKDIPQDLQRAVKHFERAFDRGYYLAGYGLGEAHLQIAEVAKSQGDLVGYHREIKECLQYFRWSADHGSTASQYKLGFLHENGDLVERDVKAAITWYQKAAEGGSANAYTELARLKEKEPGGSPGNASSYWRKASDLGSSFAQIELADRIRQGKLKPNSPREALDLYELAMSAGFPRAALRLARCYWKGELVERDPQRAIQYASITLDLAQQVTDPTSREAWPMDAVQAAAMLFILNAEGYSLPPDKDILTLRKKFGTPEVLTRVAVPAKCSGHSEPLEIYIWEWAKEEPPSEMQFTWAQCDVDPEARKKLRALYQEARRKGRAFRELVEEQWDYSWSGEKLSEGNAANTSGRADG